MYHWRVPAGHTSSDCHGLALQANMEPGEPPEQQPQSESEPEETRTLGEIAVQKPQDLGQSERSSGVQRWVGTALSGCRAGSRRDGKHAGGGRGKRLEHSGNGASSPDTLARSGHARSRWRGAGPGDTRGAGGGGRAQRLQPDADAPGCWQKSHRRGAGAAEGRGRGIDHSHRLRMGETAIAQ